MKKFILNLETRPRQRTPRFILLNEKEGVTVMFEKKNQDGFCVVRGAALAGAEFTINTPDHIRCIEFIYPFDRPFDGEGTNPEDWFSEILGEGVIAPLGEIYNYGGCYELAAKTSQKFAADLERKKETDEMSASW